MPAQIRFQRVARFAVLFLVPSTAMAQSTHEQLERLAKRRVLFAHQSVGQNLLDGLTRLAADEHVPLRVVPRGRRPADGPGVLHSFNGVNGQPKSKLDGFVDLLGQVGQVDLAAMKLCYVDFTPDTDAAALFAEFQRSHQAAKAKHPGLKVMVVTAPLTTVQRGLNAALKNTLGRGAWGERENVKRHQFNELLRGAYRGSEPFFDLAAVESGTGASACTFERDGAQWPCLRDELTDDGGHLNATGQRRLALAWLKALDEALR